MADFFRTIGDRVCEEIQKDEKALSVGYHLKKVCKDGGFTISKKDSVHPDRIKRYQNKDFKKYWCKATERFYWVLGYFGGGDIEIKMLYEVFNLFKKDTDTKTEHSIHISEIFRSRRFKGFKYIYSTEMCDSPPDDYEQLKNVLEWLED